MAGTTRLVIRGWHNLTGLTAGTDIEPMFQVMFEEYVKTIADLETLRVAVAYLLTDRLVQIGTLAISAGTAEKFKTTTVAMVRINGAQFDKAATDNLVFTANDTINTAPDTGFFFGSWLVQVDAAGTVSTKPAGGLSDQVYATAAAAEAALPAADANKVAIGYITVKSLEDSAWTANTDDLTDASDCTTATFNDATVQDDTELAKVNAAADMTAAVISVVDNS